ncbi:DUF3710 domain-containing protein [Pseudonocardia sp. CA-107938]|uniref:DUF3710 domain-containing protein n=1 Tax=Pseudonocardia sp. CA-107938 TaxID=3240021 RepID=UPI003D9103AE
MRTAERTGRHPVERTGSGRARQARPRPATGPSAGGPFDVDDADPRVSSAPGVLDFGSLRVPLPPTGRVTVEPTANGRMQAVHVTLPGGRLSVSALAAPKSSKLWPQLAKEIDASLREGGAKVRSYKGEWGRELHATTGAATSVFVGVDGPRWMVYGVATGPSEENPTLDAELRRMLRGTVVVRGKSPYPVRTVLPLTTPEELADQVEPEAAAPPPARPAPERPAQRRPARVEEPSWADPVRRIGDAGDADVPPEDEEATQVAGGNGLATSSWPVDESTGRPRTPEWTGEQRVPPRRRTAPPVAEVASAITEPILITAMPAPPPPPEPPRRPLADEPAATTRLPAVTPAAQPAPPPPPAPPPAEPERPGDGIDAYFGWGRRTGPEPAATPPPAETARRPIDPLDPAAPVDTRWLDEPGVTSAWEPVVAERPAEPAPEPVQDWAEWARQELDRAVAEQARPAPADPSTDDAAPASFWDRYGLTEPAAGGRAARRHRSGQDGEDDPFTARRRSREAARAPEPAPELPGDRARPSHGSDADPGEWSIWADLTAARSRRADEPAPTNGHAPPREGRRRRAEEPLGSAGTAGPDRAAGGRRAAARDVGEASRPGTTGRHGGGAGDVWAERAPAAPAAEVRPPAMPARIEPADLFARIDQQHRTRRGEPDSPRTQQSRPWETASAPRPRWGDEDRVRADPPRTWGTDRRSAPSGNADGWGTGGWTTGWPGTGPEPVNGSDSAGQTGGGRRRADDGAGGGRLSVAELARRAAREGSDPRRSRRTRPGDGQR